MSEKINNITNLSQEEDLLGDIDDFFSKKTPKDKLSINLKNENIENLKEKEYSEETRAKLDMFYSKLEQRGMNLIELKEILECKDSLLILSGAGSGKTTALILKIIRDLLAGDLYIEKEVMGKKVSVMGNILVSTFLKSGAEELNKSFKDWCNKLGVTGVDMDKISFKTIHSEVFSTLKSMGLHPSILENNDSGNLLRHIMSTFDIHSVMSNGKTITADEVADMSCLLGYVRNRLDGQQYNHPLMDEYTIDTMKLSLMLQTFKQHKAALGKMDFEDLQEMLLEGTKINPLVTEALNKRYDFIYVDEFQDTSQLQYELLKHYFNGAKRILAIGDDDQCLVKGTIIQTESGLKNIEDIVVGDKVLSYKGTNVDYITVNHITKKPHSSEIYNFKTNLGYSLSGTHNHTVFAREFSSNSFLETTKLLKRFDVIYDLTLFSSPLLSVDNVFKSELTLKSKNVEILNKIMSIYPLFNLNELKEGIYVLNYSTNDIDTLFELFKDLKHHMEDENLNYYYTKNISVNDTLYSFVDMGYLKKGMRVPIYSNGIIIEDEIISTETYYNCDYVYDLSIPKTRNFIANGIVVKNCIYGWRGSDIDIITKRFEQDYKPSVKQLTTNYRCASNILNSVIPSIELNSQRHPKKLKAHRFGGEVHLVIDGNVNHLMDGVKEDIKKGESVAILGRTNADLLIPAILLELDDMDIDFGLSKSVGLETRIPKQVFGMIDLITKRYTNEFPNLLKLFISKYKHYEVDKFCEILNINKEKSIYNIPLEDMRYSIPTLFPVILTLRESVAVSKEYGYLKILDLMQSEVYNGDSIYAQRARDFVYFVKRIIQEHNIVKNMNIEQLDNLFNSDLQHQIDRRKDKKTKANVFVNLSTVHEAKGKEWQNVYMWNVVDGCFPNAVGKRPLTDAEFEEERRVFYIAWTRPRQKLVVYTRSDRGSGFLGECDLTSVNVEELNGVVFNKQELYNQDKREVFKKQVVKTETYSFEELVNQYIRKYSGFEWLTSSEGVNLDLCENKLGGRFKLIEKLKDYGVDKYPSDLIESVITDTLSSIVLTLES